MVYRVCECKNENGEQVVTILDDIVTEAEFDEYYRHIRELNFFNRIEFFMEMIRITGGHWNYILRIHLLHQKKMGQLPLNWQITIYFHVPEHVIYYFYELSCLRNRRPPEDKLRLRLVSS